MSGSQSFNAGNRDIFQIDTKNVKAGMKASAFAGNDALLEIFNASDKNKNKVLDNTEVSVFVNKVNQAQQAEKAKQTQAKPAAKKPASQTTNKPQTQAVQQKQQQRTQAAQTKSQQAAARVRGRLVAAAALAVGSCTAGEGVSLRVGEDEGRRVSSAAGSTGDHRGAQGLQLRGHRPHPQGATVQGLPVCCIEGTRQVHVWHRAGGLRAAGPGRCWEHEVIKGLSLQLHAADALDGLH